VPQRCLAPCLTTASNGLPRQLTDTDSARCLCVPTLYPPSRSSLNPLPKFADGCYMLGYLSVFAALGLTLACEHSLDLGGKGGTQHLYGTARTRYLCSRSISALCSALCSALSLSLSLSFSLPLSYSLSLSLCLGSSSMDGCLRCSSTCLQYRLSPLQTSSLLTNACRGHRLPVVGGTPFQQCQRLSIAEIRGLDYRTVVPLLVPSGSEHCLPVCLSACRPVGLST
jgi:hypothetical protein